MRKPGLLQVLANRAYARLFGAQVLSLLGTGLMTVALGLLAFDLAGDRAGEVLGTVFALKMVAYVGLSPIAAALVAPLPRKAVLIGADLIRVAIALCLPFVDQVWQIYLLVTVLQAASATFTPAFQAIIPDILPDEAEYTRALSLSRLAYDLENLISPTLAGLALIFVQPGALFFGTAAGLMGSAALVSLTLIPPVRATQARPFWQRVTRGSAIYLATPRLRGLLALNLTVAAAGAFVLVNTVTLVRVGYGGTEIDLTIALAAFGSGSMLAALALPRILENVLDRRVMLTSASLLAALTLVQGLAGLAGARIAWPVFLLLWLVMGILYSAVQTPSGRLLRASSTPEDRPALFAAQFALSHGCWLLTYPLAGWAGVQIGLPATLALMGAIATCGALAAAALWHRDDPSVLPHDHAGLAPGHPHLHAHGGGTRHAHVFVIDDLHPHWPKPSA